MIATIKQVLFTCYVEEISNTITWQIGGEPLVKYTQCESSLVQTQRLSCVFLIEDIADCQWLVEGL